MISTLLALSFAAVGQAPFSAKWVDRGHAWEALLHLDSLGKASYAFALQVFKDRDTVWERHQEFHDGPLNEVPRVSTHQVAQTGKLFQIDLEVPNWRHTVLWVASDQHSKPVSFKYRDDPGNVIAYERDRRGQVTTITLYDRWVGGAQAVAFKNGQRLDRREQVTVLQVTTKALRTIKTYTRLVPNLGGGVSEKNFAAAST